MKTTVEIADDLALTLKDHLKEHQMTLRSGLDQALRQWIDSQSNGPERPAIDPAVGVFRGTGLSPEFEGKSWEEIRDASYGEPVS
jgi:hypothetical protein